MTTDIDIAGVHRAVIQACLPLGGGHHSREVMTAAVVCVVADGLSYREAARQVSAKYETDLAHTSVMKWVGDFEDRLAAACGVLGAE